MDQMLNVQVRAGVVACGCVEQPCAVTAPDSLTLVGCLQGLGTPQSRRPLAVQRRVRRLSAVHPPGSDGEDSASVGSESSELTVVDTSEARLVWTRWRGDMLDKLLLTAIRDAKKAGQHPYLRATGSNVLFPEVSLVVAGGVLG